MRKKALILLIISILSLCCVSELAAEVSMYATEAKKYSEQVLSVDMVINDVLYAGFTTRKLTSFQPIDDDIDDKSNIPKFKDIGDSYSTDVFYVYGIASSNNLVKIELDFGKGSKIQSPTAAQKPNEGRMFSIPAADGTTNTSVPELPVFLMGNDVSLDAGVTVNAFPLVFEVNPKKKVKANTGGDVVPQNVSTNFVCTDMLWLEIPKSKLADKPNISGTYRTVLTLTLNIT